MSILENISAGAYDIPNVVGIAEAARQGAERVLEFQSDLEKAFGTTGHPKADLLFSMAWERSPDGDWCSVYYAYKELSALVV